jgi:hypothetical protein
MPISRPLLIVLVAAVFALAAFYGTQTSRNASDASDDAPVVVAEPAPTEDRAASSTPTDARGGDRPRRLARKPEPATRPKPVAGVPAPVQRALARRDKVVIFFSAPRAADDRATARAVDALRGRAGVAVFADPIDKLARYRGLVGALGISQAPAIVIVGKDRKARVLEGYVDPATLAQDVADTR